MSQLVSNSGDQVSRTPPRWRRLFPLGASFLAVSLQLLGVLGALWYIVLLRLHDIFYDQLGLGTDNVGLTRTFILVRSMFTLVAILIFVGCIAIVVLSFIILVSRGLRFLTQRYGSTGSATGQARPFLPILARLRRFVEGTRHHLFLVAIIVVVMALVLMNYWFEGEVRARAEDAAAGRAVTPMAFLNLPVIFVYALPVCVYWVGSEPPPAFLNGRQLNLLGDDGNRMYFRTTGPSSSRTVSVPAGSIVYTYSGGANRDDAGPAGGSTQCPP